MAGEGDILSLIADSSDEEFVEVPPPLPPSPPSPPPPYKENWRARPPPPPPPPSRPPRGRRGRGRRGRGRGRQKFWPPQEYLRIAKRELLRISDDCVAFDELCRDWDELHSVFMRHGAFTSMHGFRHVFGPFTKDMFVFSLMTNSHLRALMNARRRDHHNYKTRRNNNSNNNNNNSDVIIHSE